MRTHMDTRTPTTQMTQAQGFTHLSPSPVHLSLPHLPPLLPPSFPTPFRRVETSAERLPPFPLPPNISGPHDWKVGAAEEQDVIPEVRIEGCSLASPLDQDSQGPRPSENPFSQPSENPLSQRTQPRMSSRVGVLMRAIKYIYSGRRKQGAEDGDGSELPLLYL